MFSDMPYQEGYIDPAALIMYPDPTPLDPPVQLQGPNSYQNMERPLEVSANAADRPEGPQALSAENDAVGNFGEGAAQAQTPWAGYYLQNSNDFPEKPPAQLGNGEVYRHLNWSRSTTNNSLEGSPAQQGSWGGGWNLPDDWSSWTTLNTQGDRPAPLGTVPEKTPLVANNPPWQAPVEPAVEPATEPEVMVEFWLADLPAEIHLQVNEHLWVPSAQQEFPAYPPPPMASYDIVEPPALLPPAANEFVPEAIDLQEGPPAQLGTMAGGWLSDLPAEETVSSLQAVTAYPFDGDYLAKAFFTLENPEAKLTEEHVPAGKGAAPSFKFATKRDYAVGTAADGTKVLYRKDGEDAATLRQVPSRDQIWAVLCGAHKDAHTGRHCGRDKTKENVERNYYGITKKMIDNFLDACPVCNAKRSERRAQLKARKLAKQRGPQ